MDQTAADHFKRPLGPRDGELIQCLDNQSKRRPLLERFLEQLALDQSVPLVEEDDRPRHAVGATAGFVGRIAQAVAVDDLRLRIG